MAGQQFFGVGGVPLIIAGAPVTIVGTRAGAVGGSTGGGSTGGGSTGGGSTGGGSTGGGSVPGVSNLANITLFGHGQSNANYAFNNDGALLLMADAANYWLSGSGAPAALSNGSTCVSGAGVYCGVSGYPSFLTWTADTVAAASSAVYNSTGAAMVASIAAQPSTTLSGVLAIVLYWGETDSACTPYTGGFAYADKAVYKAALLNDIQQIRSAFGKTAAQLPVIIYGPPYGTAQGYAMVREAWDELEANTANNLVWAIRMTDDTITRGDNWNSTTGVETLGSPLGGHRSTQDNQNLAVRGGLAAAQIIGASNGVVGVIPTAVGKGRGPQITAANLSGTALTLTITHDGGTDLVVPLLATQGVGFTLMDGGSISAPGNLIKATACSRVNATTLLVTLASAPANAHTSCRLFYPWLTETWSQQPLGTIGRGCAVTDNFATVLANANISNAVVLPQFGANMPLCTPVTRTGGGASASTTFGLLLSS